MKYLFSLMMLITTASVSSGCASDDTCIGDRCTCAATDDCQHSCTPGAALCFVQGSPGHAVDVVCANNDQCHVECSGATTCNVDCGGSADCHVTCPPTGCTVRNCVGAACIVACNDVTAATRTGTTATCP